ncbi:glycosyltransferase family 4 protein [uncultured Winogradskyella sp.]|uniref:glycosyltransferase family 4 protein n=1 Tax=uncultured Winogradskyella sp. TaxID=395353 RepID=UPI00261C9B8B|nr:glycosyltransferase family 4 protein [uncultured Winogradskyella sp.]
MKKLIRITTVPQSLNKLLEGQLQYMSSYFEVIAISSDIEGLEKIKKKEGVEVHHINMTRKITPLKDLKGLWGLYRYFRKCKPDIVHSHTPKAGMLAMIASWFAKVPNRLHTVAGLPLLEATGTKRKILNLVEKITYSCATKVYPNSNGLKDIIINEGFTNIGKLKVLGNGSSNGINVDYFNTSNIPISKQNKLKEELSIESLDFVFIFVGRIVGDKGINELITGFNKLSKTRCNLKLLLVGDYETELDPLRKEILEIIKNNKQIISTGYQEDVRPFLAISSMLVFPSYREGFPNVVMQAGAMGLASIVSNINGCNEIISEGKNGYLIEPKNVDELYESMLLCYENSEKLLEMGELSRKIIVNRYRRDIIWNELLKEYNYEK